MNINELPEEIFVHILSFLARSDRLESALACRRWAQTVARAPPLLRDIWLVIEGSRQKEAETVFANSQRHYENLRLTYGEFLLDFNAALWTKIGPKLRKLEIIGRQISSRVFHSILQACSNLESLELGRLPWARWFSLFPSFELTPELKLEGIQNSMLNLRRLHLDCYVEADLLEHFFILMPNVSSITLSHFKRESNFFSRLANMLGTSRRITMLNLHGVLNDDSEKLLSMSSASLRTLTYAKGVLVATVLDALKNCSMLRDLDLTLWSSMDPGLFQNILRNVPGVESLTIHCHSSQTPFRQKDLMPLYDLKKLRKLDLFLKVVTDSIGCVPEEIVRDLSRMITLESLTLRYSLGIVDSTRIRILASMPNLRDLVIQNAHWDAEFLTVILLDLRKLRTLSIRNFLRQNRPVMRDQHSGVERNISSLQGRLRSDRRGEQEFSSLEVLKVGEVPLTDACLERITFHHNRLRIVGLSDCNDITNAGLVTLFEHEPLLEELDFFSRSDFDGTFLEGLGMLCRRLRSLKVHTYGRISSHAEEEFKLRRPRVKCCFN